MSSKRRLRRSQEKRLRRQCEGKLKYASLPEAEFKAREVQRHIAREGKPIRKLHAYQCENCGRFHIGRKR